jgi:hypothetical protein
MLSFPVNCTATFLLAFVMGLSEACLACHKSARIDFLKIAVSGV